MVEVSSQEESMVFTFELSCIEVSIFCVFFKFSNLCCLIFVVAEASFQQRLADQRSKKTVAEFTTRLHQHQSKTRDQVLSSPVIVFM